MSTAIEETKWGGSNNVPAAACRFVNENAIGFADDSGEEKKVKLVGYRGELINHWYWGRLGIDMEGLHFAKKKTPGLIDHDTSKRLTFSQEQQTKPETYIAGPFLDNPSAQEVAQDIGRGFPFQASMFVEPEIVEQIIEGQSVQVNGKTLKGPGAVFRKAAIMEISAVVFGAFSNTESTAYSDNKPNIQFELISPKENQMTKQKNDETNVLTIDQFKADNEELYRQIFEVGVNSVMERFGRLKNVCGDDHELLVKCFAEKMDTAEAQSALITKLRETNAMQAQKLSEKQAASPEQKPDPAVSEFNNQPSAGHQPIKFDEENATDEQLTEHFNSSKDLQDEFGEVKYYLSFVKHDRKGQVKILKK